MTRKGDLVMVDTSDFSTTKQDFLSTTGYGCEVPLDTMYEDVTSNKNPGKKLRVAGYLRHTTSSLNQMQDLVDGMNCSIARIQSMSDWTYAGIYADTDSKARPEFSHLIDDCNKGLIDIP